jgi:hypothetical protein
VAYLRHGCFNQNCEVTMNTANAGTFIYSSQHHRTLLPSTEDVLNVLLRIVGRAPKNTDRAFNIAVCGPSYIANIMAVVYKVRDSVENALGNGLIRKAKKIIARAIVELCPPRARCMFNERYMRVRSIAGCGSLEPCDNCYPFLRTLAHKPR